MRGNRQSGCAPRHGTGGYAWAALIQRLTVLTLLAATAISAELSPGEWSHARKEATELARTVGEPTRKIGLVLLVGSEDSPRSAKLLLEMSVAAGEQHRKLANRLENAEADLARVKRQLRKKYGRKSSSKDYERSSKWRALRDRVKKLQGQVETEEMFLRAIVRALGDFRSPDSVAVLVDLSDRTAVRARRSVDVRRAILRALWHQPIDEVVDQVLAFATDKHMPQARARVLHWIGMHKVKKGFDVAVASLRARESAVARSAVAALRALDDPRCVPALIEARPRATGLLAEEMELALNLFTGKEFFGAGADVMWAGWWRAHGESWLKSVQQRRYAPTQSKRKGDAAFYGIETRSQRIVFVLDRSGSMEDPVAQRGPVSGTGAKDRVPGRTRLEVAKNQLARTIRRLPVGVKFAVVFYSHDVHSWKPAPAMLAATPQNKRAAIDWFMNKKPVGSTMIFDALAEALRYAKVGGGKSATDPKGADTIFLLSDGAPSTRQGNALLKGAALEEAIKKFLDSNKAFRCVVHTAGVGAHDRRLMQRLARETGGTYKVVGVR